tara:strand:- start:330 stop:566 length:237 start_codon:yes stop_codon:yes gene_type:complete
MTFQELVNMTRQEQLGVWIEAGKSGDAELEELVMSAMAATQTDFSGNNTRRGPQLTRQEFNETEAQRSERLNMLRRHS